MARRFVLALFGAGFLAATVSAQRPYTPPRTSWGDPDLQGTYTNKDENGIPFERPGQFAGKNLGDVNDDELKDLIAERSKAAVERAPGIGGADTGAGPVHWYENYGAKNSRAWLVVDPPDGTIPAPIAEAGARNAERARLRGARGPADAPEDRSLYDRCITRGIPGSMMPAIYGNSYEIIQSPGWVAIRYEMIHETRLIPVGARPHVSPKIESYMGDARAHFEGGTLVVETTNFKPASAYRGSSEHLKLVERFTPKGPKTVEWSVTASDPHTWARPWTFAMNLTKDPTQAIFEYGCHEGNYGLRDILSGARADDAAAGKAVAR
ncbi:MAG TPA: hypothetical protein VN628_03330 [Vicinamibacterales bacterium]|nr:hypothetical protein [Vicinamibacterales bacterium]